MCVTVWRKIAERHRPAKHNMIGCVDVVTPRRRVRLRCQLSRARARNSSITSSRYLVLRKAGGLIEKGFSCERFRFPCIFLYVKTIFLEYDVTGKPPTSCPVGGPIQQESSTTYVARARKPASESEVEKRERPSRLKAETEENKRTATILCLRYLRFVL